MATIVINNCVQISVEAMCSGQPVVNVLHFTYPEGTFINTTDVLTTMKTAWERANGPLKMKSNLVSMVGYKLTDLSSTVGATSYLASTATGGSAGAMSTMASAALVKMGGGTRSRSGSGRLYHGPLAESDINADGRTLSSAFAGLLLSSYQTFRVEMETVGLTWCVASRKNLSTANISNLSISSIIATQRRRLR